jgi:hypothetical protein
MAQHRFSLKKVSTDAETELVGTIVASILPECGMQLQTGEKDKSKTEFVDYSNPCLPEFANNSEKSREISILGRHGRCTGRVGPGVPRCFVQLAAIEVRHGTGNYQGIG